MIGFNRCFYRKESEDQENIIKQYDTNDIIEIVV
jgi:hypothetical protein